jgi:hypothetical protein
MQTDMERVTRSLAPEIFAGIATSGVGWLVDLAAECMATLTADELDALDQGVLQPSADALIALEAREKRHLPADDEADDSDAPREHSTAVDCQIVQFFHCAQCGDERPDGQSPRDWARLALGLTADRRLQVWCVRHDREVGMFRLAPQTLRLRSGCEHLPDASAPPKTDA